MNILIIHQYFLEKESGGGSRFNQIAKYWAEKGHQITVIAGTINYITGKRQKEYKGKWIVKKEINKNITVLRCYVSESFNKNFLNRLKAYFSFTFSSTWAGLFCVPKQDILVVTSPPLFVAIPAYIIKIVKRIPLIFEIRDLWPKFAIDTGILKNPLIIKLSYWIENFIYKKANLINVLTPAYKEYLINKKGITKNKIIYIPNSADLDICKPDLKNNWVRKKYQWNDKFVILYVGAHGVANDLWQIIETAKLLKNNNKILFSLVGDGMEKAKLQGMVKKENLNNIQFLNSVPKNTIVDFINAADLCTATLQPVFTTTYPNKVFDYMACAKPIILPIDGVCRKLVIDEARAGIFVRPGNANDFKEKILYLYQNDEELKKMGQNGYQFVLKNFDRQKLANKYLEIILDLIKN